MSMLLIYHLSNIADRQSKSLNLTFNYFRHDYTTLSFNFEHVLSWLLVQFEKMPGTLSNFEK